MRLPTITSNWSQISQHPGYLLRPVGLLPFTLFALFVAMTASPLYQHLTRIAGARKPIGDNDAVRATLAASDNISTGSELKKSRKKRERPLRRDAEDKEKG
ncbi:hypothetical protein [Streptomyces sp. NPDC002540]